MYDRKRPLQVVHIVVRLGPQGQLLDNSKLTLNWTCGVYTRRGVHYGLLEELRRPPGPPKRAGALRGGGADPTTRPVKG